MDTILKLLKHNARLSSEELSSMTGLSVPEVEQKIKCYEKKGIIMGYSAILNEELIEDDNDVTAYVEVKITPEKNAGYDAIAKTIAQYDEVESVTLMSGAYDLAVTISGTNVRNISLFISQRLSAIEGVLSTATHFILKRYKDKGICIDQDTTDERGFVAP
ncbi:MAG: Lrp/AsnC family transcriptional regulator [Ruminococcus sp.]|nr:Lrp/AsnC family transcriptional regulator [Ruminococcus sp.]MCD7800974.1 Lrp/AsnC family transcriptional regulator [Ruminococcus sp.]